MIYYVPKIYILLYSNFRMAITSSLPFKSSLSEDSRTRFPVRPLKTKTWT